MTITPPAGEPTGTQSNLTPVNHTLHPLHVLEICEAGLSYLDQVAAAGVTNGAGNDAVAATLASETADTIWPRRAYACVAAIPR